MPASTRLTFSKVKNQAVQSTRTTSSLNLIMPANGTLLAPLNTGGTFMNEKTNMTPTLKFNLKMTPGKSPRCKLITKNRVSLKQACASSKLC